ncbi:MAG: hypothetical protein H6697_12290, partial [Myxococcales bacterium]|nr:hypothetical protein [Myxococcales bacterium]
MTLPASTRRLSLLLAGALSVLLAAIPCAAAAATTRLAASVLGDVWGGHQAGGHGALLLAADLDGRHADGCIALDTETLRLGISGLHLSGGVSVGLDVVGELGFAGLLPDYYRDGTLDRGRGFAASYALAAPRLDFAARGQHFGSVVVGVRRWAFATLPATDAALELPPDTTVVELTGRYTLWRLRGGSDWVERQRRFPRVEGVALGAELGVHLRTDAAAWGARDPDVFAPPDLGNSPDGVIVRPRIWLRAGTRLPSGWRWQLSHVAGWGVGEDDLTGD